LAAANSGFQGDEEVTQMQAQAATLPPDAMSTVAVTLRAAGMSHRTVPHSTAPARSQAVVHAFA
jgi:hypothetical protein